MLKNILLIGEYKPASLGIPDLEGEMQTPSLAFPCGGPSLQFWPAFQSLFLVTLTLSLPDPPTLCLLVSIITCPLSLLLEYSSSFSHFLFLSRSSPWMLLLPSSLPGEFQLEMVSPSSLGILCQCYLLGPCCFLCCVGISCHLYLMSWLHSDFMSICTWAYLEIIFYLLTLFCAVGHFSHLSEDTHLRFLDAINVSIFYHSNT